MNSSIDYGTAFQIVSAVIISVVGWYVREMTAKVESIGIAVQALQISMLKEFVTLASYERFVGEMNTRHEAQRRAMHDLRNEIDKRLLRFDVELAKLREHQPGMRHDHSRSGDAGEGE